MKNLKINALIVLFFSIIACVVFLISEFSIEPRMQGILTKIFAAKPSNPNVMMVLIDNKSINRIKWPWKRALYGDIFEYIHDYGHAKVIVYDSLISSPDLDFPESDKYFFNKIKKYDNFISAFDATNSNNENSTLNENELKKFNKKFDLNFTDRTDKKQPRSPLTGILKLNHDYIDSVKYFGSVVTPMGTTDGIIRTALPIVKIGAQDYPMLAFYAYAKYMGINNFFYNDRYLCSDDGCKTLKINIYNSPLGVQMYLKWYRPIDEFTTHKSYSAIDVLDSIEAVRNNKKPVLAPEIFKDKIVIVGGAAKVKGLEDIKDTPLIARSHSGADIQATAISNLLNNETQRVMTFWEKGLIAFLIVLISSWIITALGLTGALVSLGAIMIVYFITSVTLFANDIVIQVVTPLFLIILVAASGFTYRFLIEGRKKEQIQNAMGMYISKDIMKSVVKNIDNLKLGGKRANITVLFSDIRGFTSISEKLSAEEVTSILNEYFSAVEPIIRKHNGVLNKFIGDAVLAIFGEPIQDKNHALNAVLCANEMHKQMAKLQDKWELEGKPRIEIGIAINTGDAFVGNIGSSERIEYTVIGDTVNTASRIESYNKVYKTRFLISESTYEKVSRICDVIKIREVQIRGKSRKINIYEVLRVIEENNGANK